MCMYVSTYLFIYLICIIYFSYLSPLSLSLSTTPWAGMGGNLMHAGVNLDKLSLD